MSITLIAENLQGALMKKKHKMISREAVETAMIDSVRLRAALLFGLHRANLR